MNEIRLVGYWNGSEVSPEITFNTPVEATDSRQLVSIHLKPIFENSKTENQLKGLSKKTKKLTKSLKKALKILK